jgi:hypothetical protein
MRCRSLRNAVTESVSQYYTRAVYVAVVEWNTDDVCQWLDRLGLTEYKTVFTSNDIRGQELVSLSRVDLKVAYLN